MMKRYMFHYNGSEKENHYEQLDYYHLNGDHESLTEHELLSRQDGNICKADLDSALDNEVGKLVEAYFEDGNELDVYVTELEEIEGE